MIGEELGYQELVNETWSHWDEVQVRGGFLQSIRGRDFSSAQKEMLAEVTAKVVEGMVPVDDFREADLYKVTRTLIVFSKMFVEGSLTDEIYWAVRQVTLGRDEVGKTDLIEGNGNKMMFGPIGIGYFRVGEGEKQGYVFSVQVMNDMEGRRKDAIDEQMEIELGVKLFKEGIPLGGRTRELVRERLGLRD